MLCQGAGRVIRGPSQNTHPSRLLGLAPHLVPSLAARLVAAPLLLLSVLATQRPVAGAAAPPPTCQAPAPVPAPALDFCVVGSRSAGSSQSQQRRLERLVSHLVAAQTRPASSMAAADAAPGALQIERVPCLSDNYSWLIHEPQHNLTAVVDPAEVPPVLKALEARQWKLTHILNTHHHWDHVGGNEELKKLFGVTIVGPAADKDRIPGIDVALQDGDSYQFGATEMRVLDTPGHTRGHITLHFPQARALFPGDTLFAMGCGRVFEGTHQQMWESLSKLLSLPADTLVYPAHEYTQSNARFAVHADPENEALRQRKAEVDDLRSKGVATLPCTLGDEFKTNPFLRPDDPGIRKALGIPPSASTWEAFGVIRTAKDGFR